MNISFDAFLDWAQDRFDDVEIKGTEVKLNSIFAEDTKRHMWCSPTGGKYQREGGVYHCWKTGEKGTLLGLVMKVDHCSFQEAKQILSGETPLGELEEKLEEFFKIQEMKDKGELVFELPNHTYPIYALNPRNISRMEVTDYLEKRKLSTDGLLFCTAGIYRNRIVIPYYDAHAKLIYFNCRHIGEAKPKYLGPPKELGIGKSDVIYARRWPKKGEKIYLTEGEFDALTLCDCGFNGMACGGKNIDEKQIDLIKDYQVCLAFDGDAAGLDGMLTSGKKMMSWVSLLTFVRPPDAYKDWNEMLIALDAPTVSDWIKANEKTFDEFTELLI